MGHTKVGRVLVRKLVAVRREGKQTADKNASSSGNK